MAKIILVHGSGHRAASWEKTVSCLGGREDVLCPELSGILGGRRPATPISAPPLRIIARRWESPSTFAASLWAGSWPWRSC